MNAKTLTIGINTLAGVKRRMKAAARGNADATPRYTFRSAASMARTLTPGRWAVLEALTGAGPVGVRELARRVQRDVKGVHTDAQALVLCGLIDKTRDGKLSFPFDAVKVQFELHAAA